MTSDTRLITTSPRWFSIRLSIFTVPRSGRRPSTFSLTSDSTESTSPGRTGLIHLRSSKPMAPVVACTGVMCSTTMRMNIAPVSQPLAVGPAAVHGDADDGQHDLAVLVERLDPAPDEADGLAPRGPGLEHLGAPAQGVPRPHRLEPAGGGETGGGGGGGLLALVGRHARAHQDRAGVPAARDEPAEDGPAGRLGVGVERLRIVLAGEGEDLRLGD